MIRILLVDDHPVVRHGVRALLDTQPDFTVIAEAGSLSETAAALAVQAADIALIDLDLGTDQPGGFEITRMIRTEHQGTRVIVFTAYDSDADVVRAVDAGASGYLVKDSRPAALFQAIRAAASAPALTSSLTDRLRHRDDHPDDTLTARELEVLSLAADGLSNRDIAAALVVSQATVKTHLHHAFTKLNAENRQAAVAAARKRSLIR